MNFSFNEDYTEITLNGATVSYSDMKNWVSWHTHSGRDIHEVVNTLGSIHNTLLILHRNKQRNHHNTDGEWLDRLPAYLMKMAGYGFPFHPAFMLGLKGEML